MISSSGVYWVASSDDEIARARALLRDISQPGVLDELGFLVLLGAFSDRLYPALNTIMTRARYLVFVPAIMRYLEARKGRRNRDVAAEARELQYRLAKALEAYDSSVFGIIGKRAGRDVARPPSNVYWTALNELQISKARTSEALYYDSVARRGDDLDHVLDDDGSVHDVEKDEFWDLEFRTPGILTKEGEFPASTSFHLSFREAKQLRERYDRIRIHGEPSLMSHLFALGEKDANLELEFRAPWDIPELSPSLERIVGHARRLSLLARGAQLQYHSLLFEKRRASDAPVQDAFDAWWSEARKPLSNWDVKDFTALQFVAERQMSGDSLFLQDWRDVVCSARTSKSAFVDKAARDLVREREKSVRGAKGRLRSSFHLRQWQPPDQYKPEDIYGLSFRHVTAQSFAREITEGLRRGDV